MLPLQQLVLLLQAPVCCKCCLQSISRTAEQMAAECAVLLLRHCCQLQKLLAAVHPRKHLYSRVGNKIEQGKLCKQIGETEPLQQVLRVVTARVCGTWAKGEQLCCCRPMKMVSSVLAPYTTVN